MDEFLKMDIFFVVATIALAIVAVLLIVALLSVLRILRYVEKISETVSDEAQLMRSDISDLRSSVREEGFKLKHLSKFVQGSAKRFLVRYFKS